MKLYRPVGLKELELILVTGSRAYPPRLQWQPIFYPVLNFEYARQIATRWNLDDEFSGYAGFVTEFEIDDVYVGKFEVQNVGADLHNELWVPAEELVNFNAHIQGYVQVSGAYYGAKYQGETENSERLKGLNAAEQFAKIEQLVQEEPLENLLKTDAIPVQINFAWWRQTYPDSKILDQLMNAWKKAFPKRNLS